MESHHVARIQHLGHAVRPCFLFLGAVFLCACAGDDASERAASYRADSLAVESGLPLRKWSVSPEPVLRIGVADGMPSYQFYDVRFAGRLRDGRVVVVDGGSGEIRWYDASGRHSGSVGRLGQGPGEFRDIPGGVLTAGDTLVVYDARNQRLTRLSPAEAIVRAAPLTGIGSDVRLLNVLEDGRTVFSQSRTVPAFGPSDFTYTRDSLAILVYSPERLDTVTVMEGDEAVTWVSYVDGRPRGALRMELPFGFRTLAAATRQHIVVGVTAHGRLDFLDPAAQLVGVVRLPDVDTVPVSANDRSRFIQYIVEQAKQHGAPDLALVLRGARDRLALLPEGRNAPPFDRMIVDDNDRIWVRDFMPVWEAESPQVWTVYSASGAALAQITTPAGLQIMHAGSGHVTGVMRDESKVEYVVVHRFDGSS